MSHFITFSGPVPFNASALDIPTTNGVSAVGLECSYSSQTLPNDTIGTFTLTLQNLVVGSLWEIEVVSVVGVSVKSGVSVADSAVISLSSYQTGSVSNTLRIKVRNSSASPYYQAFETQIIAFSGASSIFVNQVRDDI